MSKVDIFEQRKTMKHAYMELFKALFKIPDKEVQQRVVDAINGVKPIITNNKATQTEALNTNQSTQTHNFTTTQPQLNSIDPSYDSNSAKSQSITPTLIAESQISTCTKLGELEGNSATSKEPRKRKRKICMPRVFKQSQAQLHQQQLPILNQNGFAKPKKPPIKPAQKVRNSNSTAKAAQPRAKPPVVPCSPDNDAPPPKKRRGDNPINFDFNIDFELWRFDDSFEVTDLNSNSAGGNHLDKVHAIVEKDYREAEKSKTDDLLGHLPIHDAICESDIVRLRRQIYVWKKLKKTAINDVLTDKDKDCIEVALNHNSSLEIIELLINEGCDVNCFYEDIGNVLHLAICNEVDLEIIKLLARKVEFKMFRTRNDDGYTPLFLALRHNNYLYLEALLQIIDERLNLPSYNRDYDNANNSDSEILEDFTEFYQQQCQKLQTRAEHKSVAFLKKRAIVNEADAKTGTTMLLFSIEQQLEHFVYLLLVNLADPLVLNYAGHSARSFYSDYESNSQFHLKIDKIFETIEGILYNEKGRK